MQKRFNGGIGALLCDNCFCICATGKNIPTEARYQNDSNLYFFCCEKCQTEYFEKFKKRCKIIKIY